MRPDRDADASGPLAPPRSLDLLGEIRALGDVAHVLGDFALSPFRARRPRKDLLVILAPGFGSDERYLAPLQRRLERAGFPAEGWGLGRNLAGIDLPHRLEDVSSRWSLEPRAQYRGEASVPLLVDRFNERLALRSRETGLPIALLGWSLGGYICREAARDLPDMVERVVTLGSPTVGGPKYTAAAPFFRKRGLDLDWIEREVSKRESNPIRQPITAIYSTTDGIVAWRACIDRHSPNVRHVEVDAPHLGMGFNRTIWRHVLAALDERPAA